MEITNGTISQNYGDYQVENTLFTLDANELEQIKLAKKIYEQEIGKLEYFTFYQIQLENGMSESQAILYNFIEGYTKSNRDFYYSNDTISEKLKWGKDKITATLKQLEAEGYIVSKKRIKNGGGLNRFVKTTGKGNPDLLIRKNRIGEIGKTELYNSEKPTEVLYNNNINYNNIINNNTEFENSEFSDLEKNNSLSTNNLDLKEKEKNSAKKEKEITVAINGFISDIKSICNDYGVAYDNRKERMFAKHILTAKEYGDFCDKIGQGRIEFAENVLIASIKINYWKGPLAGPMKIYQNYADLYNISKSKIQKTITPTINVL